MSVPTIQSYQPYPTPVPSNQQVVIPQITIPQPFTMSYPQMAMGQGDNRIDQTQQATIPGPQLTRVKGLDGAKVYQTQANGMYALFDEDDDILYIKTTDQNNYPSLRRFRFVEEEEPAPEAPPEYVTKEEFTELSERLNDLSQKLEAVL